MRFAWRNAGYSPQPVSKTIDGFTFEFLLGDVTGRDWYSGQTTLSDELAFLRDRLLTPGDVVFECGAHHGFTTLLIAHWIGPNGHVTAFEASPSSAAILRSNIERNHLEDRVTVLAKAVGSSTGTMRVTGDSNSVALGRQHPGGVQVPMVRLDDLADLWPTVLKLDVEGFELEVLAGAKQILATRPRLAIEVHVEMLRGYGRHADELWDLIPRDAYEWWIQLGAEEAPRPYAGERLDDQRMDQVHLFGIPHSSSRRT
jgi:FkbM family methyltransferase